MSMKVLDEGLRLAQLQVCVQQLAHAAALLLSMLSEHFHEMTFMHILPIDHFGTPPSRLRPLD